MSTAKQTLHWCSRGLNRRWLCSVGAHRCLHAAHSIFWCRCQRRRIGNRRRIHRHHHFAIIFCKSFHDHVLRWRFACLIIVLLHGQEVLQIGVLDSPLLVLCPISRTKLFFGNWNESSPGCDPIVGLPWWIISFVRSDNGAPKPSGLQNLALLLLLLTWRQNATSSPGS